MKNHKILCILILAVLCSAYGFSSGMTEETSDNSNTLTVYAYDSFVSEWGPAPLIIPKFEEKTGIDVQIISAGSGGELLTRLELEKNSPRADVVVGISSELLSKTLESDLLTPYDSPVLSEIPDYIKFDETNTLLPFNFGAYSFNYDSEVLTDIPRSLDDLLDSRYENSIIIMDPRTSSVGMGLLEWTVYEYGDDYLTWWENIKDNLLTIADGWSSAYGLYTEGEAPIVLSYTTSPVYHIMWEQTDRYKATSFDKGNYVAIEGVGILKSTKNIKGAQAFVDFLLSEAQSDIAVTNIMYPANMNTELPEAFNHLDPVTSTLSLDSDTIRDNRDTWVEQWVEVMSR
ncbi:MAG: thiamine ABC transporter substrate-binding protein [Sphaerochaetaceae bacterium]